MASQIFALLYGQASASLPGTSAPAVAPGQAFSVPGDNSGYDITWDVVITGTAPTTLVVNLEGALDAAFTVPIQIDTNNQTASYGRTVTSKETPFLRLNITTLTGGDGTTRILGRIYLRKRGAGL